MAASSTDPWRWREHLRKSMTLVPAAETLPVQRAAGRLLARPLHSPEDVPSGPVSAMDGFAVRSGDLSGTAAVELPVVADLPARPGEVAPLAPGTAVRIMTGAPVPQGADLVVQVPRGVHPDPPPPGCGSGWTPRGRAAATSGAAARRSPAAPFSPRQGTG
ncbi:hypothetical protein [Brachybacterium massiliense]|uniref:hypothetical protein n=1 Tax=Brachybacterium massiliense TaxID=1755098 RepID=UPI0014825A76|nr:hypothetical protein [Brachybacterium massiliense]